MWDVPLGANRRALGAIGRPSPSGAIGVDPVLASPYRRGACYDGYGIDDLMMKGELEARFAELAARSLDQWRRKELQLGGAVAAPAAELRALALEDEILAARGGAIRSSLEGALSAQGLAERTLLHADARTGKANGRVAVGELELKASMEELERATEGFSIAQKSSCDAEATYHRARELLANREAAVPDLAVRVREAHEHSQYALRHQEAAADPLKDAERISSQAESEEQDSQRTLEDCQREFESAVAELKSAIQIKTEAGKQLANARRVEGEALRAADMATQQMIRSEEAKQFVKSLATQADATATFAENHSQLRLAKFPPDPEGVQHAAESRAKQQQSQEQSQRAEKEFEQAGQKLVQKKQDLEDARGQLERAEADYHDRAQKGLDCAARASTREAELESARARHKEAAAQLAGARAVLARARAFYQQQEQLYLDKKALEEKLSEEQAEAQSALEKAKMAVAAAAENVTGSRQHLAESTSQLQISRKRADNARLGASRSRGNQAWSAAAEDQARLQSMLAADHSLALQEGWALHRAAHAGVSWARAATFEQVVDEERAFACAARNADVAAAKAAELDFRADVAGREAALLGVSPIAESPRRWPARRFDASPASMSTSAGYPSICFTP